MNRDRRPTMRVQRWLAGQTKGRPPLNIFLGLLIIAGGLWGLLSGEGIIRYGAAFFIFVGAFNLAVGIAALREGPPAGNGDSDRTSDSSPGNQPRDGGRVLRRGDWVALASMLGAVILGLYRTWGDWRLFAFFVVWEAAAVPFVWRILARDRRARRQRREERMADFRSREIEWHKLD